MHMHISINLKHAIKFTFTLHTVNNINKFNQVKNSRCPVYNSYIQAVKKCVTSKSLGLKRREIKGSGQEKAVVVGQWQEF